MQGVGGLCDEREAFDSTMKTEISWTGGEVEVVRWRARLGWMIR